MGNDTSASSIAMELYNPKMDFLAQTIRILIRGQNQRNVALNFGVLNRIVAQSTLIIVVIILFFLLMKNLKFFLGGKKKTNGNASSLGGASHSVL
jgi:hypothetical protein